MELVKQVVEDIRGYRQNILALVEVLSVTNEKEESLEYVERIKENLHSIGNALAALDYELDNFFIKQRLLESNMENLISEFDDMDMEAD